jgi:hypothetical protein
MSELFYDSVALVKAIENFPECVPLLFNNKYWRDFLEKDLCFFIHLNPICISLMLRDESFSESVDDEVVAEIINGSLQYVPLLLSSGHLSRVIPTGKALVSFIEDFPETAPVLLSYEYVRRLIGTRKQLGSILEDSPQCILVLLSDDRLRQLSRNGERLPEIVRVFSAHVTTPESLLAELVLDSIQSFEQLIELMWFFPWSASVLVSNKRLRGLIQTQEQLYSVAKAAPRCILELLGEVRLKELLLQCEYDPLDEDHFVCDFIICAPECGPLLLSDKRFRELVRDKEDYNKWEKSKLTAVLKAVQNWTLVLNIYLGQWDDLEFNSSDIWRIIEDFPESLSVFLLNERLQRDLINNENRFSWIFKHYPKAIPILLTDRTLWERIESFSFLYALIKHYPSFAMELLSDVRLQELVLFCGYFVWKTVKAVPQAAPLFLPFERLRKSINGFNLVRNCAGVMRAYPHFATQLFSDTELRGNIEVGYDVAHVVKAHPAGAMELLSDVRLKEGRHFYHETLSEIIHAAPESIPALFALLTEEKVIRELRKITQPGVVKVLSAAPQLINVIYPRCFLLCEPAHCALIMSLISLHGKFDDTAPLPCVEGDVNWALYLKPLTNAWLNQLMRSLEEMNTPRACLTQAYLLFQYARKLKGEMEIGKSIYDAITLLAGLYQRNPELHKITKYLLFEMKSFLELFPRQFSCTAISKSLESLLRIENYVGGFLSFAVGAYQYGAWKAQRKIVECVPPSLFFGDPARISASSNSDVTDPVVAMKRYL